MSEQTETPGTGDERSSTPRASSESSSIDDHNRAVYESRDVVKEFTELEGLFPCEEHFFERFVPPGKALLDLGVGAGRTVPYLSARSRRYVGVDYSQSMVGVCRRRFPSADVRMADASDLSAFDDAEFDTVVFSYNGLDYLHPVEKRRRCISEMARVLAPGGVAVVSTHNARALVRPKPTSGRALSQRVKARAVQVYASARLIGRALPSRAFWNGEGYVRDTATDNVMFAATSARVQSEFTERGFEFVECVGSRFPVELPPVVEPWLLYAFRRRIARRPVR